MRILVTIRDNYDENYKHEITMEVSDNDYFTLKDYDCEDYDGAWDRLCSRIDNTGEPEDWYIDHIKFIGKA